MSASPAAAIVTDHFVGGAGNVIAADRFGPADGPLVLLVPGGGQTRHSWRRAGQRLAEIGYHAIAIDLRGHGDSDRAPNGDYRYDRLIEDLAAIIRSVGRPAVLVGASVGGKMSLAASGYLPEGLVRGMVLVDAVPRSHPGGISRVAGILNVPAEGFASLEDAAEILAQRSGRAAAPGAADGLRRNMRQDAAGRWHWHWDPLFFTPQQELGIEPAMHYLETAASRVTVPAMLLWGEKSDVVDATGAEALGGLIPQLEIVQIAGAGHMIVGDQNDAFVTALVAFLERHPPV